jgi:hypothetical protein
LSTQATARDRKNDARTMRISQAICVEALRIDPRDASVRRSE